MQTDTHWLQACRVGPLRRPAAARSAPAGRRRGCVDARTRISGVIPVAHVTTLFKCMPRHATNGRPPPGARRAAWGSASPCAWQRTAPGAHLPGGHIQLRDGPRGVLLALPRSARRLSRGACSPHCSQPCPWCPSAVTAAQPACCTACIRQHPRRGCCCIHLLPQMLFPTRCQRSSGPLRSAAAGGAGRPAARLRAGVVGRASWARALDLCDSPRPWPLAESSLGSKSRS